jgi:hypothetical protein
MSKLDISIHDAIYPSHYVGWIDPEDFFDKIQYHMAMEGVEMSDATYGSIWEDVERNNLKNRKRRLTEEEKLMVRAKRNELEVVNE